MRTTILPLLLGLLAVSACQRPQVASGFDYAIMDTTSRAGDNFYRYATGHWIDLHPQKPEYPRWTTFTMLDDENTLRIQALVEELSAQQQPQGSTGQKIADLYRLFMDSVRLNQEGAAPILPYLQEIAQLSSREQLLARMCHRHDELFWSLGVGADDKRSTENAVWLWQGGLTLGNKDYYTKDDEELVKVRQAWLLHGERMLVLTGMDSLQAHHWMQTVLRLQTSMAQQSRSREQLRDPESNYHKLSVDSLVELTHFDWKSYLQAFGYGATDSVIVGQPEALIEACRLMTDTPLEELKQVYAYLSVNAVSDALDDRFLANDFAFQQVLTGAEQPKSRCKRAVDAVDNSLSDALGQLYVERYFPKESKEKMLSLVHGLQEALGERIDAQEWMSDSTKQVARLKLAGMRIKIGYPDTWDCLDGLVIDPQLTLVDNLYRVEDFYWHLDYQKHYNKPVNPEEWHMSPQTVNAYYNPGTNEICFPAGILQPPFFHPEADLAVNYGAIGVVIGHEMTHGFDDQGRQYDLQGNLRQWWSSADVDAFQVPADAMATYFDSLWVIPGDLHANGKQCLGENLADHGGLSVAYAALTKELQRHPLPTEQGYTPAQRFFLSYAQVWAGVCSEEMLRRLYLVDVHSAAHLRVNGGVAQMDAWYEAFGIAPTDSMYVAPEQRVRIW